MARLKVFVFSDGFHSHAVAVTSRARALEAWGVSRDLFKDGEAKEVVEGPDYVAAIDRPGEVVSRGLAVDIGQIHAAPPARKEAASTAKPAGPTAAQRRKVETLETQRDALARDHANALADAEEARDAAERAAQAAADHFQTLRARQARADKALDERLRQARKAAGL